MIEHGRLAACVMSSAQCHMVAHCLRMPGTSTQLEVKRAGHEESIGHEPGKEAA